MGECAVQECEFIGRAFAWLDATRHANISNSNHEKGQIVIISSFCTARVDSLQNTAGHQRAWPVNMSGCLRC